MPPSSEKNMRFELDVVAVGIGSRHVECCGDLELDVVIEAHVARDSCAVSRASWVQRR